jgi:hypothetical protein
MCGGLRSYLRMCGHDAVFAPDRRLDGEPVEAADAVLALAGREERRLVTRNGHLAERASDALLVGEHDPVDQLRELHAAGVDLTLEEPPTFCGACNGSLTRVAPEEPTADYAPDPRETAVWRCTDCGQQFWRGSHWERVERTLAAVRAGEPLDGETG